MEKKKNDARWLALGIVLSAPLLYVIDIFIINMAIPAIQKGVNATDGEVQLVIAGYLLGSVPEKFAGVAAGVFSTFQQTASALGISILGGVFYFVVSKNHLSPDYLKAFDYGITANIVCLGLVAIMLYRLPKNIKPDLAEIHVG